MDVSGDERETTWVAKPGAAWSCARTSSWYRIQRRRFLIQAVIFLVVCPVLFVLVAPHRYAMLNLWLGVAIGAGAVALDVAVHLFRSWRFVARIWPPGHRLTCRIGPDYLVMVDSHHEIRFDFVGFVRVDVVGEWFFVMLPANNWGVYPSALIPHAELTRIRQGMSGRERSSAQ